MAVIDINWKPDRRQLRQFAGLFLVFGAAAGGMLLWRGALSLSGATWVWGVAAVVGLTGILLPPLVRPVYVVMMALALPIGLVVSTLLLALVFYGVMTPIGWLMRLSGYDAMHRRFSRDAASHWIERGARPQVGRYFRQY